MPRGNECVVNISGTLELERDNAQFCKLVARLLDDCRADLV